eukprot:UN01060
MESMDLSFDQQSQDLILRLKALQVRMQQLACKF